MDKRVYIQVKTSFEGFHCYPMAPKEVDFLREPHRHIFHVTVRIRVTGYDRVLEFIQVQRIINSVIKDELLPQCSVAVDRCSLSCEMMADLIGNTLKNNFGFAVAQVEVSEDNENSGIVVFE